jgi:DNA-binding transcriptional ArsR family regulator
VSEVTAVDSSADLYEQFARIGKAVASARRVELLDLLCQGERSVEALANAAQMGVTNTSQHLQILRAARLVDTRKEGTKVIYRLADEGVCRFFLDLCDVACSRLAEVEQLVGSYVAGELLDTVTRQELLGRIERGDVVVLDVRPPEEFAAGHTAPFCLLTSQFRGTMRGSEGSDHGARQRGCDQEADPGGPVGSHTRGSGGRDGAFGAQKGGCALCRFAC